jgi:hypothetical protein
VYALDHLHRSPSKTKHFYFGCVLHSDIVTAGYETVKLEIFRVNEVIFPQQPDAHRIAHDIEQVIGGYPAGHRKFVLAMFRQYCVIRIHGSVKNGKKLIALFVDNTVFANVSDQCTPMQKSYLDISKCKNLACSPTVLSDGQDKVSVPRLPQPVNLRVAENLPGDPGIAPATTLRRI